MSDYEDILFVIDPKVPNTLRCVVRNMKRRLSISIGEINVNLASQRKLTSVE